MKSVICPLIFQVTTGSENIDISSQSIKKT